MHYAPKKGSQPDSIASPINVALYAEFRRFFVMHDMHGYAGQPRLPRCAAAGTATALDARTPAVIGPCSLIVKPPAHRAVTRVENWTMTAMTTTIARPQTAALRWPLAAWVPLVILP